MKRGGSKEYPAIPAPQTSKDRGGLLSEIKRDSFAEASEALRAQVMLK
jgi:hypothetical protein